MATLYKILTAAFPRHITLKTQREPPHTRTAHPPQRCLSRLVDRWATHTHTPDSEIRSPRHAAHTLQNTPHSPPSTILHSHRKEKNPTSSQATCPSYAQKLGEGGLTAGEWLLQAAGEWLASGWRAAGEQLASGWRLAAAGERLASS